MKNKFVNNVSCFLFTNRVYDAVKIKTKLQGKPHTNQKESYKVIDVGF